MNEQQTQATKEVAHVGPFTEAETHVMNLRNIASFVQRDDPQFAEELCNAADYIENQPCSRGTAGCKAHGPYGCEVNRG